MEQPLYKFPGKKNVVFLCNHSTYSYYLAVDIKDGYIYRVVNEINKITHYGLPVKDIIEHAVWPNDLTNTEQAMEGYRQALQLAQKYLTII